MNKQGNDRRKWLGGAVALGCLLVWAAPFGVAQTTPSVSVVTDFSGSVTQYSRSSEPLRLSLVDAVRLGLQNNLGLRQEENAERSLHGQKLQALQSFLPTIALEGGTGVYEHSLVSMGFSASVLSKFTSLFPSGAPAGFSTISKDDLTYGQINFQQTFFSGPVIAGWKAASASERAAHYTTISARDQVVEQVAKGYLRCLAAASDVDEAKALAASDEAAYEQAHARHAAGVVAKLDELRAQLQHQTQEQAVIAAQGALQKTLIQLKRAIGVEPARELVLTDAAPYSELVERPAAELLPAALEHRMDYMSLKSRLEAARAAHAAYRSRRLPSLSFGGYWGVDRVNGAGAHGDFAAVGRISLPIFREAGLRGDEQAAAAQAASTAAQLDDLRERIAQQLRISLLDLSASQKLVDVARSNIMLAERAVSDETARVAAGVDDNLPLVAAQASLAAAHSDLIERLYQFNLAKLSLAKASGVLETEYRELLGL